MTAAPGVRDYLAEVKDQVNAYLDSHDSVISARAADELVSKWEASDPGLLAGWLRARSRQIVTEYVYKTSLSRGARRSRAQQRDRFKEVSEGIEGALQPGGPGTPVHPEKAREFYRYHTVTEGPLLVRKPLSDMTAVQVGEVRDRYRQASKDNAFYAKVCEAVRKRVAAAGDGKVVSDVYDPETLEKMFAR